MLYSSIKWKRFTKRLEAFEDFLFVDFFSPLFWCVLGVHDFGMHGAWHYCIMGNCGKTNPLTNLSRLFLCNPFCFATIGSRFNHFHRKGKSYTKTFLKIIIHKFYQVKFYWILVLKCNMSYFGKAHWFQVQGQFWVLGFYNKKITNLNF